MTNKEYFFSLINQYNAEKYVNWNQLDPNILTALLKGNKFGTLENSVLQDIMTCKLSSTAKLHYMNAKSHELLSLTIEKLNLTDNPYASKTYIISDYDLEKMNTIRIILASNLAKAPTIDELSKTIGMNPTKLKRAFKDVYHTTIYGYLREKRLEYSKNKLYDRDLTIAEIANEIGYSNPSKYATAFRKKYGVNPKEIRNKTIHV